MISFAHTRYSSVSLSDRSQQITYAVNALYREEEFPEVAKEWSRITSEYIVIVQTFEMDKINALATEILELGDWVAHIYSARGVAGVRMVVLKRGGMSDVEVPRVMLKPRVKTTAETFLNYQFSVPAAAPSKPYPDGHPGGVYAGSSGRAGMKKSESAQLLFLNFRGREHLNALDAGEHASRELQRAVDAKRSEPGGDPAWLPFARDGSEMSNVKLVKTDLGDNQDPDEAVTEMIEREQIDLNALGDLAPRGRRLATSWLAGSTDPDSSSRGGSAHLEPGERRSDGKISQGTLAGKSRGSKMDCKDGRTKQQQTSDAGSDGSTTGRSFTNADGGHRGDTSTLRAAIARVSEPGAPSDVGPAVALDVASACDADADEPGVLAAAPPASASQRLAGPGDVLLTKCKTLGCTYGPKLKMHGGSGKRGQWKCGRAGCGCNKTAYCTQCGFGGAACAQRGECFAITDPALFTSG